MGTSTWVGTTLRNGDNNGRLAHIRGRDNCRVIVLLVVPKYQWRMSVVMAQRKQSGMMVTSKSWHFLMYARLSLGSVLSAKSAWAEAEPLRSSLIRFRVRSCVSFWIG